MSVRQLKSVQKRENLSNICRKLLAGRLLDTTVLKLSFCVKTYQARSIYRNSFLNKKVVVVISVKTKTVAELAGDLLTELSAGDLPN